jgi:hypothetical protein
MVFDLPQTEYQHTTHRPFSIYPFLDLQTCVQTKRDEMGGVSSKHEHLRNDKNLGQQT